VVVCDDSRLVADAEEDVLEAALTEKLAAGAERNLDDAAEFGELFRGVVLNVRDALSDSESVGYEEEGKLAHLKIGNELLHNGLPGNETLDKDVGGTKVCRLHVLLYERLCAGLGRVRVGAARDRGCARDRCGVVVARHRSKRRKGREGYRWERKRNTENAFDCSRFE
jgi:hypothetical protein